MKTKIQRWGNSLGLPIPKSFAEEARVQAGSTVELTVEGGALVVRRARALEYDLRSLGKGINAKNLHEAVETGPHVGREAW